MGHQLPLRDPLSIGSWGWEANSFRFAWDGELVSAVLAVFLRVVRGWYRRQAEASCYPGGRCGSVTFLQRFGSSINLNPHGHVLMPDGVYVCGDHGLPEFVEAPPLTDQDVQSIVETTAKRVVRLCQRRGLLEDGAVDPLMEDEPLLAQITAASVQGTVATGERAGRRVQKLSPGNPDVRSVVAELLERGAWVEIQFNIE